MAKIILFNKPFRVLSQFTDTLDKTTLSSFIDIPDIYPAGRLDFDSEGLMILTDDGAWQHHISHPRHKLKKTYWVQVEGEITDAAIKQLCEGVELNDGKTKPASAKQIPEPDLWQREPPVRYRANIPTSWIELSISEGRNRQVRRMTAAVQFPTLRLVRQAIGEWTLDDLQPGQYKALEVETKSTTKKTIHRKQIGKPPKRDYRKK